MSNDPFFYALNSLLLEKAAKIHLRSKKAKNQKGWYGKQCSKQTLKSQTLHLKGCESLSLIFANFNLFTCFTILNRSSLWKHSFIFYQIEEVMILFVLFYTFYQQSLRDENCRNFVTKSLSYICDFVLVISLTGA